MELTCKVCGKGLFAVMGRRPESIVLRCRTCRSEPVLSGFDVSGHVEEDIPEAIVAVGYDADDPWVTLRLRVKTSQRDVFQRAMGRARTIAGHPDGPIAAGSTLEWICADFLAGCPPEVDSKTSSGCMICGGTRQIGSGEPCLRCTA